MTTCEDAPCCGCCAPAEIWTIHPADQEAWENWLQDLRDPTSEYFEE